MNVKELIEQLKTFDQDKTVILRHTDHTDFTYTVVLSSIGEEEWYNEELDNEEKSYEDCLEDVVIIDCNFW